MVSLSTAKKLKKAGLEWKPATNDFFAIPDRGFDDKIFVISDMFAYVEKLRGRLAVTFHGMAEWALDYIMVADLIWLPTEAQLREELEKLLPADGKPALNLTSTPDGYICQIRLPHRFSGVAGAVAAI
jgi:hypothetical protein